MPTFGDLDKLYYGTTPLDAVYIGAEKVWPEEPDWVEAGSFRPFDWFHADGSRVPDFLPPIYATGATCTFDRASDSLIVTFPTPYNASVMGAWWTVEWPTTTMAHPDPRNPTGYKLLVDADWDLPSNMSAVTVVGWSYWSADTTSTTTFEWGLWGSRFLYPRMRDPDGVAAAGPGIWTMVFWMYNAADTYPAGTIRFTSPSVTWLQPQP